MTYDLWDQEWNYIAGGNLESQVKPNPGRECSKLDSKLGNIIAGGVTA